MVKERNVFLVVLFSIITFGIYGIYWLVSTSNELKESGADMPNPWILLAILIPIVNIVVILYYYWKYSKAMEQVTNGKVNGILMFVLWLVFGLISVIWAQLELNKLAKGVQTVETTEPAEPVQPAEIPKPAEPTESSEAPKPGE